MPVGKHIKVGITGGIGVGKSTVCRIFEQLKVPIYNADTRAKELMNSDEELKKKIRQAFGWDAYDKSGRLDRQYLAKIVFNSPKLLDILNKIVHPAVFHDYNSWVAQKAAEGHPYSIKEAALMFETDSYKQLDRIIVVTCPIDVRIERIMKRDHMKRDEVLKRMENQLTDKERLAKADYIIKNSGDFSLIEQSLAIHHELIELSQKQDLMVE